MFHCDSIPCSLCDKYPDKVLICWAEAENVPSDYHDIGGEG